MFLSGEQIKKAVEAGDLGISPFLEGLLKPASYTLTLGEKLVDSVTGKEVWIGVEGYSLKPGEFVLGQTAEVVKLNNKYLCILGTRGSLAQKGVDALQSSIIAEPYTNSQLTLEISNHGQKEVVLLAGMPIVKAIFSPI